MVLVKLGSAALLNTTLLICAFVTTGLVAYRTLFVGATRPVAPDDQKASFVENWSDLLDSGTQIGLSSASVKIIEFSDFECPFCARFGNALRDVRAKYPNDIAVVYVHFPIPTHRFAIPAARAAECAG